MLRYKSVSLFIVWFLCLSLSGVASASENILDVEALKGAFMSLTGDLQVVSRDGDQNQENDKDKEVGASGISDSQILDNRNISEVLNEIVSTLRAIVEDTQDGADDDLTSFELIRRFQSQKVAYQFAAQNYLRKYGKTELVDLVTSSPKIFLDQVVMIKEEILETKALLYNHLMSDALKVSSSQGVGPSERKKFEAILTHNPAVQALKEIGEQTDPRVKALVIELATSVDELEVQIFQSLQMVRLRLVFLREVIPRSYEGAEKLRALISDYEVIERALAWEPNQALGYPEFFFTIRSKHYRLELPESLAVMLDSESCATRLNSN